MIERTREEIITSHRAPRRRSGSTLAAHCYKDGFFLVLHGSDGVSRANSKLFTWQQIAQLLIAADPDLFGVLDEPLHQVFPETLVSLRFNVPNWREQSITLDRNVYQKRDSICYTIARLRPV